VLGFFGGFRCRPRVLLLEAFTKDGKIGFSRVMASIVVPFYLVNSGNGAFTSRWTIVPESENNQFLLHTVRM